MSVILTESKYWNLLTMTKKVLVCPLDWGIGHATRCVPLIGILREMGWEVWLATDGRPYEFLRKEIPGLNLIRFPGTKIRYPKNIPVAMSMFMLTPRLLWGIYQEHRQLKQIAEKIGAGLIISDNRYGCWHQSLPSVFITHQLDIQVPSTLRILKGLIRRINYFFIRHYKECWIPDFELHLNLAGALSHPPKLPPHSFYIGNLSRFPNGNENFESHQPAFDLMIMLSGPEPQRTLLEEKIMGQLSNINLQVLVVRGIPETEEASVIDNHIHLFSHLDTARMRQAILQSGLIICRSGYSSIMDVVALGKRAIFIPTPGQTEQEYLSRYLMEKKIFFSMDQKNFDLLYAIEMSKNFPGVVIRNDYRELRERIQQL